MLSDEQITAIETRLNLSHMVLNEDVEGLIDEVRRQRRINTSLRDAEAQQRRIIAALREAVEAYADEGNWAHGGSSYDDWWLGRNGYDAAREALAQVATIEGEAV